MDEEEDDLHNPHDKLFKRTFGIAENAASFLKAQIPRKLAKRIDWSQLKALPNSYIDPKYAIHETDLVFSVPLDGQEIILYVLFEHQSTFDRWIVFRLLGYEIDIWRDFLKSHPEAEHLPPILPVVLCQNAKHWESAPRMSELVEAPACL
jgi:predicted transposase/invertase (TIGR01784 family)